MPITSFDQVSADPQQDEEKIRELVAEGIVTERQVMSARAEQLGLPFVDLTDYPVDRAAVAMVPPALLRRHEVLPIGRDGDRLLLAMADPRDVLALDDIRAAVRMQARTVMAERNDLLAALDRYLRSDSELSELTVAMVEEGAPTTGDLVSVGAPTEDDAPVVRFVNLLISQAIQDHASDIHIEPGEHALDVRYRIDGVLHEMQSAPKSIQNGVISRLKIMSEIDIAERRKPQDGRMSVVHGGNRIDLRVATLPTVHGEKVVMRILDNESSANDISDLHMLDHNFRAYESSYKKPHGMILVTGPTGSGKSTTLYTTLHAVAKREINVITVEDPVERRMPGINQMQVNVKAGLTFAAALRSILRADPDVVLIGEIRDQETAQIAIEASLTGHLVLSTLHTNSAPAAVTRLIEMDIEPFLVGSALESVVAQRLARRLCDRCKQGYQHDQAELERLQFPMAPNGGAPLLFRPVGCVACSNTGYRGRIALHEVMLMSEEVERLAVARSSTAEIARAAIANGMLTLRQDGWAKAALGYTSIEEVLRVVA
jgi:type IV pilus assembly protein PilB